MYTVTESHGQRVLTVDEGVTLGGEGAALDLIGHAFGEEATVVAVPVDLVDERFFTLGTRVAGEVLLKFSSYRVRLAILGDLGPRLTASESLRAFVHEANRGRDVWFLDDAAALDERLRGAR